MGFFCFCISAFLRNFFLCQVRLSGDVPPHLAQPCCVALGRALIWGLLRDGTLYLCLVHGYLLPFVETKQYGFHLVCHPHSSLCRDSNLGPSTPNGFKLTLKTTWLRCPPFLECLFNYFFFELCLASCVFRQANGCFASR